MEQRKLIKLGNSSFAVALPKAWIKKSGLKKGEVVFLQEGINGEIILNSEYKKTNTNTIKLIDLSEKNDKKSIQREITIPYIRDYGILELKGIKGKKEDVKEAIKNLMGLEIVDSSEDKIILKDFFDLNEADMQEFLRRMDNIIRSIFEDLEEGIKKGELNKEEYSGIINADQEINKVYLLINRLFVKGTSNPAVLNLLKTDIQGLFNHWWLSFNLEYIGDELKRIARIISEAKIKKEKVRKILNVLEKTKENYISILNSYYKNDKELAFKTIAEKDEIIKYAEELSQEKESSIAKIGEKLKGIQNFNYQINKVILYST